MNNALYDKKVKCLYCDKEMTSKTIKSKSIRVKKTDDDFCRHFEGENIPYLYDVIACPHCGFVFTPSFMIADSSRKEIRSQFLDKLASIQDYCSERTIQDAIRL